MVIELAGCVIEMYLCLQFNYDVYTPQTLDRCPQLLLLQSETRQLP